MQNISHTVPFGENMCSICTKNTKQGKSMAETTSKRQKRKKEIKRAEISWLEFCSFVSFCCVFSPYCTKRSVRIRWKTCLVVLFRSVSVFKMQWTHTHSCWQYNWYTNEAAIDVLSAARHGEKARKHMFNVATRHINAFKCFSADWL